MKAAVFEGNGVLTVKEVPEPTLDKDLLIPKKYKEGYVRVRKEELVKLKVLAAGICGTDLHILSVPPGHPAHPGAILGHEFVGEVVEVGKEIEGIEVGDIVAVDPNIKCGKCYFCRMGYPNLCENMTTIGIFGNGGFAEYVLVPDKQIYKLPKNVDVEKAALFEPLTTAVHNWKKVNLRPGESIIIFGAGPLGMLYIMLARISGANEIFVVELSEIRKKIAKEIGATHVIDPREVKVSEYVKEVTGYGADAAIDAAGVPIVVLEAIEAVRPGGRISLFGEQNIHAYSDKVSFTKANQKELKIFGSYIAIYDDFYLTVELIKRKDTDFIKRMITHRLKLDEILKGIELMRKKEAVKVLIFPNK